MAATIEARVNGTKVPALVSSECSLRRPVSTFTLRMFDRNDGTFPTVAYDDEVTFLVDGVTLFTGLVRGIRIDQRQAARDLGHRFVTYTCYDYGWRCAHPASLISAEYDSESDRTIVQELLTAAGLNLEMTAPAATVAELDTNVTISFGPDATYAECMDQLCKYTGAVWYVDASKRVVYDLASAMGSHDWDVDQDSPDKVTSQRVAIDYVDKQWPNPVSELTYFGANDYYGIPLQASASTVLAKTYGAVISDSLLAVQQHVDAAVAEALAGLSVAPQRLALRWWYGSNNMDDIPLPLEQLVVTSAVHDLSAESFTIEQVDVATNESPDPIIRVTASTNKRLGITELLAKLRRRDVRNKVSFFGYDYLRSDNEYSIIPSATETDAMTEATFACWLVVDSLSGDQGISHKNDNTNAGWDFYVNSAGRLRLIVHQSISNANVTGSVVLTPGTLYHVAFTYSLSAGRIYVNGVQDASANGSGSFTASAGVQIDLGYNADMVAGGSAFSRPFDGMIAGVRIWKRALPTNLIKRIAAFPGAAEDLLTGDLVGYYKTDEYAPGDTVLPGTMLDSSMLSNHGGPNPGFAVQFPHGRFALKA